MMNTIVGKYTLQNRIIERTLIYLVIAPGICGSAIRSRDQVEAHSAET